MTDLPDGWRTVSLGEVATVQGGIQKQAKRLPQTNHYPFLRVANVARGRLILSDVHRIELFGKEIDRYRLQRGDLLVVEGNGSPDQIGRAAVWDGSIDDCVHQNHLIRVRPGLSIDSQYLLYAWNSPKVSEHLRKVSSSSSGLYTLSASKLKSVALPLPAPAEQRRIVEILEEHLSRLDAAAASLQAAKVKSEALRRARIDEILWAYGDAPMVKCGKVLGEPMRNGHSARAVRDGEQGVRTLTLTAVTRGQFSDAFTKMTSADPARVQDLWLDPGDVLVQRANTAELVGTTALYEGPSDWAIFPDLLIRLRPDTSKVSSEYLAAVLRSERAHRSLRSRAKGLTGSMPKIDQTTIAEALIPLPSAQDQAVAAASVSEADDAADRAAQAIDVSLARSRALRRSLLSAAFSGRLTGRSGDLDVAEELAARDGAA